jgi:formylglycine-generating enzyme required for sulfatase activity
LAVEVRARDSGGRISEVVKRTLDVKPAKPPLAIVPFSAEQAMRHQEAWAKYIKRGVVETNSMGMKLVLIPPGRFMMGQGGDEPTVHQVTLTKAFYLADREVTVKQFQEFIDDSQYPATEKLLVAVRNKAIMAVPTRPVRHSSVAGRWSTGGSTGRWSRAAVGWTSCPASGQEAPAHKSAP